MTNQNNTGAASLRPGAGDRFHARLALIGRAPRAVKTSPEPLWTGDAAAARRLASGLFLFGGALVEAPGENPFDQTPPTPAWAEALHGFDWLDDLAASSETATRVALAEWLHDWIARYGGGAGPGWRPDVTGRRLTRWICHAPMLLNGASPAQSRAFFRAIGRQARFLRRRWRSAPVGLPRFRAAAGLVYAGLALEGSTGALLDAGVAALGKEAARVIGDDGGLPSRNPEEAMEVFALLTWAARSLDEAGALPASAHIDALPRLAAAVRALRHGDGALTRFHGGGGGKPEQIDRALASSRIRARDRIHETMGFHRLATAGMVVFFDGGDPPAGDRRAVREAAETLHASAFCFEASIGRRQVIVNCGPGARFGEDWRQAARATAAHSGLTIDDMSSARLTGAGTLLSPTSRVSCVREEDEDGARLIAEHDGYLRTHGLIHQRRISLSVDGRDFRGEDRVTAEGPGPRAAFDRAATRRGGRAIPFTVRFHIHPDVEVGLCLGGGAVRLVPPGGGVWVMRQLGGALSIEDSVYLDETRIAPRATKQIVVRAEASDYRGLVKWALRRAEPEIPPARGSAVAEEEA